MRKLGYTAEVVEHRRGSFIRVDLFGFADVFAFRMATRVNGILCPAEIILIQAYHATKDNILKHAMLHPSTNDMVSKWITSGGKFEHHYWTFRSRNKRKYWEVERKGVMI